MPVGIVLDLLGVLAGIACGCRIGKRFGAGLKESLVTTFGFCAISIGISLIIRLQDLAPVVLSLILGTLVGELLHVEDRVNLLAEKGSLWMLGSSISEEYMQEFRSVAVLFCFSGPGLVGSLMEGFAGDHSLLFAKAVMDFFTAIIFSSRMGSLIAMLSAPQAVVLFGLFFCSQFLYPLFTPEMLGNFYAVGGAVTLMAGFNMLKVRKVRVLNVLPALILIPVTTSIWFL